MDKFFDEHEIQRLCEVNKRQREHIEKMHMTLAGMCALYIILMIMWFALAFSII